MNILVAGAGYIGLPLAVSFARDHRVFGWVHSTESADLVAGAGIEVIHGDLADDVLWGKTGFQWDAIFYAASTSGGGADAYQNVHGKGLANALRFLNPGGRFFYLSSTSVYGQSDGSDVDESSETKPPSDGSKILVEAEKKVLSGGGQVLRLAGIYGPGRSVYLKKLKEGRATIPGNGLRWVNQIHREDAISALQFLWKGSHPAGIWNVSDNEAVSVKELYRWLSRETGLPVPPEGAEEVSRKRGLTHKRVLNRKLRDAGWSPRYPTFREGYRELIQGT